MKKPAVSLFRSITTKLLIMNMLFCIVLIIGTITIFFSFRHIENLLTQLVVRDVRQVTDNARTGRELVRIFSSTDFLVNNFFGKQEYLNKEGTQLAGMINNLVGKTENPHLETSLKRFTKEIQTVLEQCAVVNNIYKEIETLDQKLDTTVSKLGKTVSDKIITLTMEGEETISLQQIGYLISGYSETILRINVRLNKLGLAYFELPMQLENHPLITLLDHLDLRMRVMTAYDPEIANYGGQLMNDVRKYREALIRLHESAGELKAKRDHLGYEKEKLLSLMGNTDIHIAETAGELHKNITNLIQTSSHIMVLSSCIVIIILSFLTIFYILSNIQKPMKSLLSGIEAISAGNLDSRICLNRQDEWHIIETALNRMSAELKRLYPELQDKLRKLEEQEEALRESEEKYRGIFENAIVGIFQTTPDGRIINVNFAHAAIMGYDSPEDLISSITDLSGQVYVNPDDRKAFTRILDEQGNVMGFETQIYRKDRTLIWVSMSARIIRDEDGNILYLEGTLIDITKRREAEALEQNYKAMLEKEVEERTGELNNQIRERIQTEKALRESEQKLLDIVNFLPDATFVIDKEGKIIAWNKAIENMTGKTAQDMLGKGNYEQGIAFYGERRPILIDLAMMPHEEVRDKYAAIQWQGNTLTAEAEIPNLNNKGPRWVFGTASVLYDSEGNIAGAIEAVRDITERRILELDLKKAKEAAESANSMKSMFLASMSHEIRTPMNAILGFTELLVPLVADGQQKNYLQAIQAGGKNLLTLINDILDLSKIEAGKLEIHYEPVNPYTIFEEIRHIFALKISQKNLEFVTEISKDIPQSLLLDEVRLRQVLFNLIGNAVKFTEKGYIKLSADRVFTADDRSSLDLLISVEDTGIGISPEAKEKIFQAFIQQDGQSTRKYGGTGLGLTISRRLVEMMNGEISLASEPGKGSVFRIILRNVSASVTVPKAAEDLTAAENFIFDQATVLVTDDVQANRLLIKAFFDSTEIRSIEAENGQEAVSAAEQFIPDLILMDITMPVMDGYEAVRQIRNNEKTKQIPVIALTARAMSQEKEKIISAGFDGYLTKPINRAELFHEISRFLVHSLKEESSEKIPSAATETLSPEVIEKLPEIMRQIENEFTPLWKDVCEKQFIGEIEDFAGRIVKFAEEYSLGRLADFGKEVINHCQNCDIENIESVMKFYPKLIGDFRANISHETEKGN